MKNHQTNAKIVNFGLKMSQVEPKMAKHGNKTGLVEHLEATWSNKMTKNGTAKDQKGTMVDAPLCAELSCAKVKGGVSSSHGSS